MDLGQRIKLLREKQKMNQSELAICLKISNSTLSQYETGARTPSDDVKVAIADFFGVSVDYLLRGVEQKEKPSSKDGDALSGKKNSPGTTEAAPGDARISLEESNHLLIALGLIKEGQQLSVDDLAFLTHIIGLLEAWFSKRQ